MNRNFFLRLRNVITFGILLVVFCSDGFGQKINWGNAANDANSDSNGDALSDATFTFQLGTFTNGDGPPTEFIPDISNTDFWGVRWVALDTAIYNQEDPPDEHEGFFSDSWIVPDDTYQGFQAYIWGYNNQAGDATSEWVLITDNAGLDAWKIPSGTGTQQNFPDQWRVSTATDPIFGGLNNVDGPGETGPGAPPTFALQTNTFLPVPESSTAILFGLTLGSLVMRRSRPTA